MAALGAHVEVAAEGRGAAEGERAERPALFAMEPTLALQGGAVDARDVTDLEARPRRRGRRASDPVAMAHPLAEALGALGAEQVQRARELALTGVSQVVSMAIGNVGI